MVKIVNMPFIRIFKAEVFKTLHQKRLLLAVSAFGLFSFLLQLGFRIQRKNPFTMIAQRGDYDLDLVLNSINTTRLILNSSYIVFFPILAVMIFAAQFAGERSEGTLWGILARPISRTNLFFTKFLVSSLALLMVVLFFIGFTLLIGCIFFGIHDFLSSPRIFDLLDGNDSLVLSFGVGVWRLFLSGLLLTFFLLPTGAIAYYCSLLFHHTHTAMATSLLLFFGCYIVQGLGNIELLTLFVTLKPYLITSAMDAWMYIFYPTIGWNEILPRAGLLLVYLVALLAMGLIHFRLLDLSE
jgi:ABC-type transport system involved in multi-copper enzyme maturation permease subunit